MNNLDRALRIIFRGSAPTPADLERAEHVYRSGVRSPTRLPRRRRLLVPASAVVVAVVAITGAFVATRPSPVHATLTEIAYAARTVDVAEIGAGAFYHTESTATQTQTFTLEDGTELTYRIDEHRRIWINPGGGTILETTRSNPTFETETDRAIYFERGLDAVDRIGETQTTAVDEASHPALDQPWPHDSDALLDEIRTQPRVESDTDAVDALLDLITESPASADLRAATIEALGRLDLSLVAVTDDGPKFRTVPTGEDTQIIEFTIATTGQLVERVVYAIHPDAPDRPALLFKASYSPTRIVDRP